MRSSLRFNYRGKLLVVITLLSALGAVCAPGRAAAANNDVIAIPCATNPVHVADFKACATAYNLHHGQTGLFIVVSQTSPMTALVQSTGTWTLDCSFSCMFFGGTLTPVNLDGTPLTTDAQLAALDQTLFAEMRAAGPITKPIKIPPNYGVSYINNDTILEDTPTAINQYLLQQGITSVPTGTVVTVVWSDGTTCQWIRVYMSGSYSWAPVPGTAKDANGNPINPNGTQVANPHSGGSGSGVVEPTVTPSQGFDWSLFAEGGRNCTISVTVSFPDGSTLSGTTFGPCP